MQMSRLAKIEMQELLEVLTKKEETEDTIQDTRATQKNKVLRRDYKSREQTSK